MEVNNSSMDVKSNQIMPLRDSNSKYDQKGWSAMGSIGSYGKFGSGKYSAAEAFATDNLSPAAATLKADVLKQSFEAGNLTRHAFLHSLVQLVKAMRTRHSESEDWGHPLYYSDQERLSCKEVLQQTRTTSYWQALRFLRGHEVRRCLSLSVGLYFAGYCCTDVGKPCD
jgi:hypothetical protein